MFYANNEAGRGLGDGQEVPDYGIYNSKDWPNPDKGQAAMITRMDRDMGRIMKKLSDHGIAKTPSSSLRPTTGITRKAATIPTSSTQRTVARQAGLDRWHPRPPSPGGRQDRPGAITHHAVLWRLHGHRRRTRRCRSARTSSPSASCRPCSARSRRHDYLLVEFYERGGKQAVRFGKWKAIRIPMHNGPVELFDLSTDLGELFDVSAAIPRSSPKPTPHGRSACPQSELGDPRQAEVVPTTPVPSTVH